MQITNQKFPLHAKAASSEIAIFDKGKPHPLVVGRGSIPKEKCDRTRKDEPGAPFFVSFLGRARKENNIKKVVGGKR